MVPRPTGRRYQAPDGVGEIVDVKKVLISFIPWVVFSVLVQRAGVEAAGVAALLAAVVGGYLAFAGRSTGVKLLDLVSTATFAFLAAVALAGGSGAEDWVADYGRGSAAVVLGLVMLGSTLLVPFTEQYARESVPQEYWHTATFRSVNRRISAAWGSAILLMSLGHLLAGVIDPASAPNPGARPVEMLLNWILPVLLVLGAVKYTQHASHSAGAPAAELSSAALSSH